MLIAFVSCTNKSNDKQVETPKKGSYEPLLERSGPLAKAIEWNDIKGKANQLMKKINADSMDTKSRLKLAQLYMSEARITGEHPYYYPATLTLLNDVLEKDPKSFEAHALKASVLLSLHHFSEAKEVGEKAVLLNPNNGFIYGVLVDANVELGNYEEAVALSDKMQSIRPGLESYSRASYLREIHGDNQGAIDAMQLAYKSGMAGSEEASWAGNTLAHLYLNSKEWDKAKAVSELIIVQRPSYAFSLDAIGLVYMEKGQYDSALMYFEKAIEMMPEFSFYKHKADVIKLQGDKERAMKLYKEILPMLAEDAESGHYMDLEQADIYIELENFDKAEKHVSIEYKRRPENIDVNLAMAKVLVKKKDFSAAQSYLQKAKRTGKKSYDILELEKTILKNI